MNNKKTYSTFTVLKRFMSFSKPYKLLLVAFIFISLLNMLIGVSQGYLVNNIVDSALKKDASNIILYLYIIFGTIILGIIVTYLMKFFYGYLASNTMKDFRLFLFRHVQRLPIAYHEEKHSGDLLTRFTNDATSVQNFFGQDLLNILVDFAMLLGAFIYLSTINWKLLVLSIILTPFCILGVNYMSNFVRKNSQMSHECSGKANSIVQDSISGITMVKSFNMEEVMRERYEVNTKNALKYTLRETRLMAYSMPMHIIMRLIPVMICVTYGGYLSIKKMITPGELTAFIYLLGYISWPLALLVDKINQIKSAVGASERIIELLDQECERDSNQGTPSSKSNVCIDMKNVSFSYKEGRNVLNNLNLRIMKGKKVALVGLSGCGKSTLLKLFCGFQTADSGILEVFGRNVKDMGMESLRSDISIVTQDTYLYPVSFMENISYGKQGATIEEIIEAAKLANAYDFIMAQPEGFQTQVGEMGVKLSGGQRQRIALARAALKNAPIFLLDEPTSALDTESEALVNEALERILKGKTAIIVAHRLSTIKNIDEIFVLEDGQIIESGSHEELIKIGGSYMKLYEKQF